MPIITTPVQAPRANAIGERWIASARRERTDTILSTGRRHLHHTLSDYAITPTPTARTGPSAKKPPDGKRSPSRPRTTTSASEDVTGLVA